MNDALPSKELCDRLRFTWADNGSGYNSDFTADLNAAASEIERLQAEHSTLQGAYNEACKLLEGQPTHEPPAARSDEIAECVDILRNMVNFAHETGYHEIGYDVVTRLMTLMKSAPPRVICKSCSQEYALSERHNCPGLQPAPPPGDGWQPIETAPKSGNFQVCLDTCPHLSWPAHAFDGELYSNAHGPLNRLVQGYFTKATHWRPAHSPPTKGDGQS